MKRYIDRYNVTWHSPSARPADTMPIGNGDLAADVRTAPDGDVVVTLAKGDAWDESGSLLKLGRVRIRLSPRLLRGGEPFRQILHVESGMVEIMAGTAAARRTIRVWVDAHEPTVWVEAISPSPQHVTVFANLWRMGDRELGSAELGGQYGWTASPDDPPPRTGDTLVDDRNDHLIWYHHNDRSRWFETWDVQGLGDVADRGADPLLGRTFGCLVRGEGFARRDEETLTTNQPMTTARLQIVAHTDVQDSPARWLRDLVQLGLRLADRSPAEAWRAHIGWWASFWDRSYIHLGSVTDTSPQSMAFRVSSGYQLQRYLSACAGRGRYPIKFNGSLFTFATNVKGEAVDPDYRRWGGLYPFQNTRLAYWPMLATGDWEMMRPLFAMYDAARPMARERCRHYFRHSGVHFPETMTFWGSFGNDNYGWDRTDRDDGEITNDYIRWHYNNMLELVALMLAYVDSTGDTAFLRATALPMARDVLEFFTGHYDCDDQGTLVLEPAQALETYIRGVRNPMPDVAGLHWVVGRLLTDHDEELTDDDVHAWQDLARALPPLPVGEREGLRMLLPAERYENQTVNMELPELYAVFPFRHFGPHSDNDLALNAFHNRRFQHSGGWHQDGIFSACLGLADKAWHAVVDHLGSRDSESAFPGFRGPNFNWIPDQDQGNVGMIALQYMLLHTTPDGALHILPAWPADTDVHFRLHAPHGIVVQGTVVGGRAVRIVARDADGATVETVIHKPQPRGRRGGAE